MEDMEQIEQSKAPQKRKKPTPESRLAVPGCFPRIGKDVKWYFDIRLWAPVLLVLLILCACTGSRLGASGTAREYDAIIEKMEANWEEERQALELLRQEANSSEAVSAVAVIDPETEALAILADVVGADRSDNVKTAIMWVAINRSENAIEGHGKSLMEEINMPLQWQGYDPEKTYPYSQETYKLAQEVMKLWHSGGLRPLDGTMMWLVLNNDGSITIRDKYQGKNMVEKTIK